MSQRVFADASPGGFGDVTERAIAFVVVENAVAVVGNEKVAAAIVIVIGGACSLSPAGVRQAGLLRHVFEMQIAEIAVQVAGGAVKRDVGCRMSDVGRVGSQSFAWDLAVLAWFRSPGTRPSGRHCRSRRSLHHSRGFDEVLLPGNAA